jgi:hypothetical protein
VGELDGVGEADAAKRGRAGEGRLATSRGRRWTPTTISAVATTRNGSTEAGPKAPMSKPQPKLARMKLPEPQSLTRP